MWDWLVSNFIQFLTNVLTGIYNVCGDWGLAIILLTLAVRLLVMPLMTRSTKASARMQILQPKLQEIQERYADDPQKMQAEMSKFYAENKFNPLGGCLPIFLQMPVFFGLFQVLRNIGGVSGGAASFYNIVPNLEISAADAFASLNGNFSPEKIGPVAIYFLLVILFGGMTCVTMLLSSSTTTDPQQKRTSRMMGIFMSVWMIWIGWGLPSGVLLFYDTSSLWQIAQQQLVTKRVMAQAKAEAEAELAGRPFEVDVVRRERKKRPHKKG